MTKISRKKNYQLLPAPPPPELPPLELPELDEEDELDEDLEELLPEEDNFAITYGVFSIWPQFLHT